MPPHQFTPGERAWAGARAGAQLDGSMDGEQDVGAALRQVQSKLGASLAAPERPMFDLGVGLNAEFDTAELSLVVRGRTLNML